jgi:O-antigen biosynthesis protein WbqV
MSIPTSKKGWWNRLFKTPAAPEQAPADLANKTPIVDSEKLLRRAPRSIDVEAAKRLLHGKRVMITGAGGTIGSELVRQTAALHPSKLIMVDNSEFNLYQIDMQMKRRSPDTKMSSLLVDICRKRHLDKVFAAERPDIVLHAGAFKHVPITEENRCPAALTNVLGTKNVFDAAMAQKCEAVVFISTDKAVNPTSFMGATKRIAELYAQALDVAQADTRFVTVRFGNVLGSTGSVVPLFEDQIRRGGPITVTHPDISRYFMTTEEAVKLVLQVSSLGEDESGIVMRDGRVFVLDMGEPIKIVDLAERVIAAYGLKPHEDIKIEFTGLRPGEKLFEEIFLDTEQLVKTGADGVLLGSPTMIDLPLLEPRLQDVIRFAQEYDEEQLAIAVNHLVPEFRVETASERQEVPKTTGA